MIDASSAATIESHTPSSSQNIGKIMTAATWKTSVLKNEMSADVRPSLKAVKKDEPNIENPENRNENEKILNA